MKQLAGLGLVEDDMRCRWQGRIMCECLVKVVSQQLEAQVKWVSILGF